MGSRRGLTAERSLSWSHGRARSSLVLALMVAVVAALAPPAAQAAVFDVNDTADVSDVNPGDGKCDTLKPAGTCTLRAAVEEANALAGPDDVVLKDGLYELSNSVAIEVTSEVNILGESARGTIVRQPVTAEFGVLDRVFVIGSGATVRLQRITVFQGRAPIGELAPGVGGNILNQGKLLVTESIVTGGSANRGGGIANAGGKLVVEFSTLSGNGAGGADPDGLGGAIFDQVTKLTPDSVEVFNSTISGNLAREGAGVYMASGAVLDVRNSTIAGNDASDRGGGIAMGAGTAAIHSSIVALNSAKAVPTTPNCFADSDALLDSFDFNIEDGTDCAFTEANDQQNTGPRLSPLENNGGQTDTHAIAQNSPAVDRGDPIACPATDQRDLSRPQGKSCDVGAFEYDFPPETNVDSGPSGQTNDPTPTFTFSANEPASFQCRLDSGQPFTSCKTTETFGPLADGPYTLEVRAIDSTGNVDTTPASQPFTVDTQKPSAPSITDSDPNSPANQNQPKLKGTAEAGSTVLLYTTSDCSGRAVASGTAAEFASPGLTVDVANNSTTNFRATATDAAQNTSACSAPFTYVEDSLAPGTPTIAGSNPSSPANDTQPEIEGTADAGTTVRLYTTSDCSGAVAASGSAAQFASPGLTVNVSNNSTTNFRATATDTAGNVSLCSASFTYVEDSAAPGTPSITDSDPNSPNNSNQPRLKGSAEAGSTVRLYTTSDCSGAAVATGIAAQFASPGLTVTVGANTTTSFRAQATDGVGNLSACSGAFTYVEDSVAPAAPSITDSDPNSPADENQPSLKGSAEAGSTVRLYTTSDCTGAVAGNGSAAQFAAGGIGATVANNTTTQFRATATDAAGNASLCSTPFTYVEDSASPTAPSITDSDPDSPSNVNQPRLKGSAEAGSTVRLYTTSDCTGAEAGSGTASQFGAGGIQVTVGSNTTTSFRATATDTAGNTSPCSTPFTYVEDSALPGTPSITDSDPNSPDNSNQPRLKGSAEAGSTVRLYTTSDCSGSAAATGTAAQFASPGLTVTVGANTTTSFRARATDTAGNASQCSASFTYIEDSDAPAAPTIEDSDPGSPANDTQPELTGSAEAGSTVRLYTTSDCTGAVAANGTAAQFAGAGLTVTVGNDTTTDFRATATDAAGNTSPCSPPFTYVEDSAGPGTPSITGSDPGSPSNINQPKVKGTADPGTTIALYTTSDCSGPAAVTGPAATFTGPGLTVNLPSNATTSIRATATDSAQNTSACSAPFTYVEDSGSPQMEIDSGPSGLTGDSTPTFDFGSAESGITFECRVDSAPFVACSPPYTTGPLADGAHVLEVEAIDAAGNRSPKASRSFTVDARPPETTIMSGPAGLTTDSTPTFEFSSDEGGSKFQCSLDGGPFEDCGSPFTPEPLSSGKHTFQVRAIDPAGNVDPSPAFGFDTGAAVREFTLIGSQAGPPQLGQSFNLETVSGEIFVSVPEGAATAALRPHAAQLPPGYQPPVKGRVFVPLEEVRQLPMGSLVDTRFGTSKLTSARSRRGRTQAGRFSAGVFQVLQSRNRRARGLTDLKLKGSSFSRCRSGARGSTGASAAQLSRRTIRRLRSSARGRFRTRGRHSAATVRGTIWITADRCDGTLTTVKRGAVAVRDFRRKRTIVVRSGKSYLAKAPG